MIYVFIRFPAYEIFVLDRVEAYVWPSDEPAGVYDKMSGKLV